MSVCLRGGNCNNGSKCGARYLNANNTASRANWNIGGSLTYPFTFYGGVAPPNNADVFVHKHLGQAARPHRTVKINLPRGAASKRKPTAVKGIRKDNHS